MIRFPDTVARTREPATVPSNTVPGPSSCSRGTIWTPSARPVATRYAANRPSSAVQCGGTPWPVRSQAPSAKAARTGARYCAIASVVRGGPAGSGTPGSRRLPGTGSGSGTSSGVRGRPREYSWATSSRSWPAPASSRSRTWSARRGCAPDSTRTLENAPSGLSVNSSRRRTGDIGDCPRTSWSAASWRPRR
ncbi:hypothetical protein GCM10009639_68650 [Kitasatospora putterlickiae]|uniref:Uncharacterized protein n=1 Tax=Kitasatospora putterlickiae TaxID=221725 RepID=A0ABN1YIN7_9ACTN